MSVTLTGKILSLICGLIAASEALFPLLAGFTIESDFGPLSMILFIGGTFTFCTGLYIFTAFYVKQHTHKTMEAYDQYQAQIATNKKQDIELTSKLFSFPHTTHHQDTNTHAHTYKDKDKVSVKGNEDEDEDEEGKYMKISKTTMAPQIPQKEDHKHCSNLVEQAEIAIYAEGNSRLGSVEVDLEIGLDNDDDGDGDGDGSFDV